MSRVLTQISPLFRIFPLPQHSLQTSLFTSSSTSSSSITSPLSPSLLPSSSSLPSPPHWGTYRPNLYLGVRGLFPTSPLFGWVWSCADVEAGCSAEQQINELRHDAEERDGVTKYGWLQHDGDGYGKQGIVDQKRRINLTTSFIRPEGVSDRWVVRIEGRSTQKEQTTTSLYFYSALSSSSHSLALESEYGSDGLHAPLLLRVDTDGDAGEFVVEADLAAGSKQRQSDDDAEQTYVYGVNIDLRPPSAALKKKQAANQAPPQQYTWQGKEIVKQALIRQYQAEYQKHTAQVQALQRQREQSQGGDKKLRAFQPPPMRDFVSTLPNTIERGANFIVIQKVLKTPFVMDFVLQPAHVHAEAASSASSSSSSPAVPHEVGSSDRWFGSSVFVALEKAAQKFTKEFNEKFPVPSSTSSSPSSTEFSQALLSNLLGGIGYFHGAQLIEDSPAVPAQGGKPGKAAVVRETGVSSLFSAVPSRSFFPRGFMWDEGFHQLLISKWSLPLTLQILTSWFQQISLTSSPPGWLPREQILGVESRARVPSEFQAQKPWVANPPTLIMALEKVLGRLKEREEREESKGGVKEETKKEMKLFRSFLLSWLPILHTHVQWFFSTQGSSPTPIQAMSLTNPSTEGLPLSFRWRGRTKSHCLASGLDDYPRAKHLPSLEKDKIPNEGQRKRDAAKEGLVELVEKVAEEGHVDLHAWMLVLAKTMGGLMEYVHAAPVSEDLQEANEVRKYDYEKLARTYRVYANQLSHALLQLHWNPSKRTFSDYVYRSGTRSYVSHIGYVSLLPLFLTVLEPTSPELLLILQQLRSDEWGVWTRAGLRSLSQTDSLYGSGEDYWRGHIWINMQYLACQALTHYAQAAESPPELRRLASSLSSDLRSAVGSNMASEYAQRGFVYEQYHAEDGKGRKSHPFTGWSALALLIMTEQ
jgi:mannosyl-oligosaccharide glucosidase